MSEYLKKLFCMLCLGTGLLSGAEPKARQQIIVYLKTPVSSSQNFPTVSLPGYVERDVFGGKDSISLDLDEQETYQVVLKNQKRGKPHLEYRIIEEGQVRLDVMDLYGKILATLVDKKASPGTYQVESGPEWNKLAPIRGLVFLSLSVNGFPVYSEKAFKLKW
jgi:hypothetical protein